MSKPLFDDDSASDDEFELGTNKEYAKHYNKYRQKELLKKCKLCVTSACIHLTLPYLNHLIDVKLISFRSKR